MITVVYFHGLVVFSSCSFYNFNIHTVRSSSLTHVPVVCSVFKRGVHDKSFTLLGQNFPRDIINSNINVIPDAIQEETGCLQHAGLIVSDSPQACDGLPSILRGQNRYSSNIVIIMVLRTIMPVTASVCDNLFSVPVDGRAFCSCVPIPTEGITSNSLAILFKLDLERKRETVALLETICVQIHHMSMAVMLAILDLESISRSTITRDD
mmetsp:Transcript_35700/g.80367  ORF Transcript_35700/g.80367 Transcript_35700/m.80367 type:complete len:209 (+) Transcript_35700:2101-2727(+)